jgi:phosphodiesterase/alkaline phosphatase D-like protein
MATGNNYTSPLLHTCKLTGLTPSTQYFYQCARSLYA